MKFIINRQKLKELVLFRGWRSVYTALAEATGFSGSYCRRVVLGKEKLTDFFMLRYIKAAGVNPKNPKEWAALFDVDLEGDLPKPHTSAWNIHKMEGLGIKYRALSPSYYHRKGDNPNIEVEDFYGMKDNG